MDSSLNLLTWSEGICLGYVIHPELMWKDEFFVASLKQVVDSAFDEPVQIMRVIKLNRVGIYNFPLADRPSQFKGLATDESWKTKTQSLCGSQSQLQNKSQMGYATVVQRQCSVQSWLVGFS